MINSVKLQKVGVFFTNIRPSWRQTIQHPDLGPGAWPEIVTFLQLRSSKLKTWMSLKYLHSDKLSWKPPNITKCLFKRTILWPLLDVGGVPVAKIIYKKSLIIISWKLYYIFLQFLITWSCDNFFPTFGAEMKNP